MSDTYKGFSVADLFLAFEYDPETGNLIWRDGYQNAGKPAGGIVNGSKTVYLRRDGKQVILSAARVIWAIHTGQFPPQDKIIWYKDRDQTNTVYENLELISRDEIHTKRSPRAKREPLRFMNTTVEGVKKDRKDFSFVAFGKKDEVLLKTQDENEARYARWAWEAENN